MPTFPVDGLKHMLMIQKMSYRIWDWDVVITYAGFHVLLFSNLQTEITLSAIEAECIALILVMRKLLFLWH